jgi:hypothetical protein
VLRWDFFGVEGCSSQSKIAHHGLPTTLVGITRVHFRVPKPENIIIFKIYLAATLRERHPNYHSNGFGC